MRNEHSDILGASAISKIFAHLPTAFSSPNDKEARFQMALAANLAGFAFNNPITHIGHAIGDAFGMEFHTPHGLSCALALPVAMEVSAEAVPVQMKKIAGAIDSSIAEQFYAETNDALVGKYVAEAVRGLMKRVEIPPLRTICEDRDRVTGLAKYVAVNHLSEYCPVKITEEFAAELLGRVYDTY